MNRYERLYREHGVVPVLIFERLEQMTLDGLEIMFKAYQPCPCKNWELDDLQLGVRQLIPRNKLEYVPAGMKHVLEKDTKKRMKIMLRREAKKHIDEFLECGTIDGEKA